MIINKFSNILRVVLGVVMGGYVRMDGFDQLASRIKNSLSYISLLVWSVWTHV